MCPRLDDTVTELTQQEAGDLPLLAAARLRRHLADCQDCAAEAAQVRALFATARSEADAAVSDILRTRVAKEFTLAAPIPEPRRTARRRFALGAAALTTGAAALAAVSLMPGTPVKPSVAFAQVEEALQNVRTASWTETTTQYDRITDATDVHATVVWVSIAPPRIHRKTLPDAKGERQGVDSIETPALAVHRFREDAYSVEKWAQPRRMDWTRTFLKQSLLFPRDLQGAATTQQHSPGVKLVQKRWRSERITSNGKSLLRFRRSLALVEPGGTYPFEETVLVEPVSHRIVLKETLAINPKTGKPRWRTVSHDYRYNQPAPNVMEDVLPPAGQQVQLWYRGFDARIEPQLLNRAKVLIDRAGAAWQRRDVKEWDAVTDFELYPRLHFPTKAMYGTQQKPYFRKKLYSRTPYSGWRIGHIVMSYRSGLPYHFTRHSPDAPFPPDTLPTEFEVIAVLDAVPPGGGKPQQRTANFVLNEAQDGSLKIIHIDFAPVLLEPFRSMPPSGKATRPGGRR